MVGAMALVAVKGTIDVGGVGVVWQRNLESGRIETPKLINWWNQMTHDIKPDIFNLRLLK